jgi:hypothetical protein
MTQRERCRCGIVGAVDVRRWASKRATTSQSDGCRWVELYPPGAPTGVALVPPGPADPVPVQTGIILNTDDIDETHTATCQ